MNKKIMIDSGFAKEVILIESGKCPFCEKEIKDQSFKDVLSMKEFKISGLCQECQDKVFGK